LCFLPNVIKGLFKGLIQNHLNDYFCKIIQVGVYFNGLWITLWITPIYGGPEDNRINALGSS
jgi:hypothetical protein